jgi:hypothetical protein
MSDEVQLVDLVAQVSACDFTRLHRLEVRVKACRTLGEELCSLDTFQV